MLYTQSLARINEKDTHEKRSTHFAREQIIAAKTVAKKKLRMREKNSCARKKMRAVARMLHIDESAHGIARDQICVRIRRGCNLTRVHFFEKQVLSCAIHRMATGEAG
jgi:hypothetical protein